MQDGQLLIQYARGGSEAAFAALVARHRALVYRTCLRETGLPAQAEDATQVVFLLLARKAKTLRAGPSLAGWLYQTARFVAKDVRKQEARRQKQEEAVKQELTPRPPPPAPDWQRVEPLLNDALSTLKPAEREVVLLRFLEGLSLSETGAALGLSEDAARMRVSRAVEKMRRYLTAYGASVTGAVLVGLLTGEAALPGPARAVGPVGANVSHLLEGVTRTMWITQLKIASLAAAVLLAGATAPLLAHALAPKKGPGKAGLQAAHFPAVARPLALKDTVKFTLDKAQQTAYSLSLPQGAFFVVLDVRRADGEWGSGGSERAEASVSLADGKGQPFPHGIVDEDGIEMSFVEPQNRLVFHPTLTTPEPITLHIGNGGVRCRYWLTVLPASSASPALSVPLFGETVPEPMRLGETQTGRLAKNGYRYFAIPLKAGDYQASLEFRGAGTPAVSLNGYLFLDDENGLTTDGSNFAKQIVQLHDDVEAPPPHRGTAPFSLTRDGVYLLTVSNQGENSRESNAGAVNFAVTITPAAPATPGPRPNRN